MMRRIIFFASILVTCLFAVTSLKAAILTVDDDGPADFSAIQAAISAASSGDTIMVRAGDYEEDIILRSGVDVFGEGYEVTFIKGSGTGNVVLAGAVEDTQLDGFTIYNSAGGSGFAGVKIIGGCVIISNNRIQYNTNGIRIATDSTAIIRNNVIRENGNPENGVVDYGIICVKATPLITNNIVINNVESGIYIGWIESSGAKIINNTIVDNNAFGVFCYSPSPMIKNNIIIGHDKGICAAAAAMPEICYNDVWNNSENYHSASGGVATPGPGDISLDPLFEPEYPEDYFLSDESPCIDAGDPNPIYNDIDGARNDMGAYGGMDGHTKPRFNPITSGFIFTTIGKIPVSEITHNGLCTGLANVSEAVAHDLHIYQYTDAPFGGYSWISGLFGELDTSVKYYQILVAKWQNDTPPVFPTDFKPLKDPLTKIKYTINPDGTVTATRVTLGPMTHNGIEGLYERTNVGYWAHMDLKIIWDTTWWENGKYDLTYKAYDSLFSPVSLPSNDQERITIVVDNSPVQAEIHSVKYDSGEVIPECGLINLGSNTENLRFTITAWHPNGYLRKYELSALYGKNRDGGDIVKEQYVGSNDDNPPFWPGVANVEFNSADAPPGQLDPWEVCAYQFRLQVWGRTTDGYTHIRYKEFNDHYYINIGPQSLCKGDFDNDGDVDGSDLSVFASEFGRTDCLPTQ